MVGVAMSTALSLPPKVALLIPLLGSDQDGEVLGAVRAIERTLKAAGCDWHDLVKVITSPPIAPVQPQPADMVRTPHDVAKWCARYASRLSDRERVFVHDMVGRLVWNGTATEKQSAWLRAIYVRLRREVGQ